MRHTLLDTATLNARYTREQMALLEGQFLQTSFAVITSNQSLKGMAEANLIMGEIMAAQKLGSQPHLLAEKAAWHK